MHDDRMENRKRKIKKEGMDEIDEINDTIQRKEGMENE